MVRVKEMHVLKMEDKGRRIRKEEIKGKPPLTLPHHSFLLGTCRRMCGLVGVDVVMLCVQWEKL